MTRFDPKRTEDLVAAALELPADARADFVKREAGGDTDLESRVLEVLSHHWTGAVDEVPIRVRDAFVRLGPYRVVRSIGEGGMGEVYLCEQESPRMPVAVKVLRAFADAPGGRRRYEVEAEALARLSHEGIARVREAGTVESILGPRPYIAMEYVDGVPLDEYARERDLGIERRLELAIEIGRAIVHAHENGVIHRDLKPSNVLVTRAGRVKVIDFGIAKLVDEDASSTRTRAGDVFGSLRYMSPEQIRGESQALDRRLDVYALGYIAYELVAGRPPFDVDGKDLAEITRAILEQTVRPLPPRVGKERRTDLDIVLQKALAKDRADRYASAAELVADLERVLRFEPIRARRPSALREIRLFARRNRTAAGAIGASIAVLCGSTAAIAWLGVSESRAAERARNEADRATAAIEWVAETIAALDPAKLGREDVMLREILDRGSRDLPQRFAGQPLTGAYLARVSGELYQQLVRPDRSEPLFRHSLEVDRRLLGVDDPETLRVMQGLADACFDLGRLAEAESLLRETLERRERVLGPGDVDTLITAGSLGNLLAELGRLDEAEPLLRRAVAGLVAVEGEAGEFALEARDALSMLLYDRGETDEAERLARAGLEMWRNVHGFGHPSTLRVASNLSRIVVDRGGCDEAIDLLVDAIERSVPALGSDHPTLLVARHNLAFAWFESERYVDALSEIDETVAACRATLGGSSADTVGSVLLLAAVLDRLGFIGRCVEECERGLIESFDSTPEVTRDRTELMAMIAGKMLDGRQPKAFFAIGSEVLERLPPGPEAAADRCAVLSLLAPVARQLHGDARAREYEARLAAECGD